MVLIGKICFYVGLFLTVIGIIAGFGFMFAEINDWAKFFLMVVPLGFLLLFTGLSTGLLFAPRGSDKSQ
ncbi:MAG: hypothetical protein CSA79_01660 [Thiothrix nivea]|nr:MAG: hypothetical protein CSA79_01660 [Thiothrix nivea]